MDELPQKLFNVARSSFSPCRSHLSKKNFVIGRALEARKQIPAVSNFKPDSPQCKERERTAEKLDCSDEENSQNPTQTQIMKHEMSLSAVRNSP